MIWWDKHLLKLASNNDLDLFFYARYVKREQMEKETWLVQSWWLLYCNLLSLHSQW